MKNKVFLEGKLNRIPKLMTLPNRKWVVQIDLNVGEYNAFVYYYSEENVFINYRKDNILKIEGHIEVIKHHTFVVVDKYEIEV